MNVTVEELVLFIGKQAVEIDKLRRENEQLRTEAEQLRAAARPKEGDAK